jgi:hypothetical protein
MIQLDLLIGHKIYDRRRKLVGSVGEIRLRRRGNEYEVDALLVGLWGWIQRVGFNVAFLWLSTLMHWEPRRTHLVRWEQIRRIDGRKIYLNVDLEQIETVEQEQELRKKRHRESSGA